MKKTFFLLFSCFLYIHLSICSHQTQAFRLLLSNITGVETEINIDLTSPLSELISTSIAALKLPESQGIKLMYNYNGMNLEHDEIVRKNQEAVRNSISNNDKIDHNQTIQEWLSPVFEGKTRNTKDQMTIYYLITSTATN